MWLVFENLQSFSELHCLILSKTNLWPDTGKSIKDSSKFFNLYYTSLKERKTSILQKENCCCDQKTVSLLICEFFWTQGKGIPRWLKSCKGIYKDSGNLKWVAWELGIDTGNGRTSINWVCKFSLPLSQLFYCSLFCLACLKNIIKLIVASSSAFWAYHLEGG